MYGWLTYELFPGDTTPCLAARTIPLIYPEQLKLSEDERKGLLGDVMAFFKKELSACTSEQRNQYYNELIVIATHVEAQYRELAMYMYLAHTRLPPAERQQRIDRIRQFVDNYFNDIASRPEQLTAWLTAIKKIALVIPDVTQENWLSRCCAAYRYFMIFEADPRLPSPPEYDSTQEAIDTIIGETLSLLRYTPFREDIGMLVCNAPPKRNTDVFQMLLAAAQQPHFSMIEDGARALREVKPKLATRVRMEALEGVMRDVLASGKASDAKDIADTHVAWAMSVDNATRAHVLRATIGAVEAGVPMGAAFGPSSREALTLWTLDLANTAWSISPVRMRLAAALVEKSRQPVQPDTGKTPVQDTEDLNGVQSWSIDQLMLWIEGPLTEVPTNKPIDRPNIVHIARQQQLSGSVTAPAPEETLTLVTEEDVCRTIDDALSATARFFLGDLQDMLPLARRLGTDAQPMNRCAELLPVLTQLANEPTGGNDLKARFILMDAEAAIDALRMSVRAAQAQARTTALLEQQFPSRLNAALLAEPKVLGKRRGGVIACPLRPEDWRHVDAHFHRRWLPLVKSIEVDGRPMALDKNQAAALYVTGSSHSGHAFDVSVHLWRRRAGRTSLPSEGVGMYPPMNTTDWFDTYITCCVLHVPHAK